ncbi:uncharacterized protein MAM_03089 [Metarhizium album ARSEF 1941]|uniref:Uncharacterized protein n=1 Tax=Metarhizium album (strain ARSEF 1941) TaxID=1081103 RepID=A0A0B2WTI6_METAS|nr:uncharacterized protein MAM_03089 [Metarhizium album ARSEF 1941]KHN99391.1 hypothetical protein MAM_03089 [Metarhizium album ARSEF 1941]
MSPPPTTPTPRRFLLAKRPPASQSPAPQAPQQFQSTPRFGSSSSGPRLAQRRPHDLEDVDADESPGDEADETRCDDLTTSQDTGPEPPSQSPSCAGTESSPPPPPSSPDRREAKRRRVSISPAPSSPPGTPGHRTSPPAAAAAAAAADGGGPSTHQPIFRPAPRFKPVDDARLPGFPGAFSPRRRGEKYLPGGHAARLQGWLAEVKGRESAATGGHDAVLRLTVERVSPGEHMCLVRARAGPSGGLKACILAGEGGPAVGEGSVVVVEQPVWEVTLAGECWTVGCNWRVAA